MGLINGFLGQQSGLFSGQAALQHPSVGQYLRVDSCGELFDTAQRDYKGNLLSGHKLSFHEELQRDIDNWLKDITL